MIKISPFHITKFLAYFAILIWHSIDLHASFIPVGKGGYITDTIASGRGPENKHHQSVKPSVSLFFSQPVQTTKWWTSLIWPFNFSAQSENLFAHPLSFKARAQGLEIGYPDRVSVSQMHTSHHGHKMQEYHYHHSPDLLLGLQKLQQANIQVDSYSDWSVTATLSEQQQKMSLIMTSGSPFVYVKDIKGAVLINLLGSAQIWYQQKEVVGLTINGHHYGIFAPAGTEWVVKEQILQLDLKGKDYYSVAIMPDSNSATLEFFRQHAYAFITNTTVNWHYNAAQSSVETTYNISTILKEVGSLKNNVDKPIVALYRHQWMHSNATLLPFQYNSSRGVMKTIQSTKFTVTLPYYGTLPFLPDVAKDDIDGYNVKLLYKAIDELYQQPVKSRWQNSSNGTDTYWMGKNLCRIAHLIPIAEQLQHVQARDLFLAEVKERLQNWFSGKQKQHFFYNPNWNTLIGYPASYGSDILLNDHHFHYAYFVMAAAIVAIYEPEWAKHDQWGGMVEVLIKDVANNDRLDNHFPFLRTFDVYAGHCWASGTASFGAGNNEESSSESINFAQAIVLWGTVTGNAGLRDLGIYLYSTLTTVIPQYWFDVDHAVFPSAYKPNTLGILWSNGGAYSIWWDGGVSELHGINFLPITPAMLYLGRYKNYLQANQAFMHNNGKQSNAWNDIHMSMQALYDTKGALEQLNKHPNYEAEIGETLAHTYHWLHTINQLGSVDETISADTALYAIFKNDQKRHYTVFNGDEEACTVHFSDGTEMSVPGRNTRTLSREL